MLMKICKCEKITIFDENWYKSMLIRFSVENFLSFSERTEFSMLPGKGRIHEHHVVKAVDKNDIPVLKSAIIYGANASGKSNVIKAISFAKKMIINGTTSDGQSLDFKNFRLDKSFWNKPSRIEFEIKQNNKNYAYGFVFDNNQVVEEWLYEIFKLKEDREIFSRKKGSKHHVFNLEGIKTENQKEKQFLNFTAEGTRKNQLFLTECKVRNVKDNVKGISELLSIYDWFESALSILFPNSKLGGIEFQLKSNESISKVFHEFLDYFNTGVSGIDLVDADIEKIGMPKEVQDKILSKLKVNNEIIITSPDQITYALKKEKGGEIKFFRMMTKHIVQGSTRPELFEVNEESDGTQRIMDFIPAIIELFKKSNVFIIDEIDRSLHPNLTYDFIDLFLSKSIGVNSQLIVTTHESALLSQKLVRKDEVWFVTKNKEGASCLYSLEEYKVRFDKEIRKDYLLGRYKAIPVFGSRNKLSAIKS